MKTFTINCQIGNRILRSLMMNENFADNQWGTNPPSKRLPPQHGGLNQTA